MEDYERMNQELRQGYHAVKVSCQTNCVSSNNKHSTAPFVVQIVDVADEIVHGTSAWTVIPFTAISNTSNLASQSHSTTLRDIVFPTPLNACPEQINTFAFVADAGIEFGKVESMFHGATLDQVSIGNIWIVGNHAVGEAKPQFDIGIDGGGAEEDDVPQAFARAVFAGHGIGIGINTGEKSVRVVDYGICGDWIPTFQ